jgi:hypothetical protein
MTRNFQTDLANLTTITMDDIQDNASAWLDMFGVVASDDSADALDHCDDVDPDSVAADGLDVTYHASVNFSVDE